VILDAGPFFSSAAEIAGTVVGLWEERPIHLRDVARILDGTEEPESYARIGAGPAGDRMRRIGGGPLRPPPDERPAVTVAVAKRKGTNAVQVAAEVLRAVEEMKGTVIPDDVEITVTRDYGETADHKVNELVKHLLLAVATIIVLLAFALGPREAFVVAIAVPMTLAITLLLDFLFGYTINRVTLFALILSLGLLVDDPIVDVENIHRHFRLRRDRP
jgi:multidrug efflux pump subunit AcrB